MGRHDTQSFKKCHTALTSSFSAIHHMSTDFLFYDVSAYFAFRFELLFVRRLAGVIGIGEVSVISS